MNMKMLKRIFFGMLIVLGGVLCAQESSAYIREITGTVEVKAPGAEKWRAARKGERISRDTIISTSFKSSALIALENSTLTVQALTRLSLEEIQNTQGNELVRVNLQTGRVRAEVSAPAKGRTDFTVQSPVATASVRGTAFDFDGVNLSVDEGQVHVTGEDGTGVYVGAGHESISDSRTGRTAGAAEMIRAELSLASPPAAKSVVKSANANLRGLTLDAGFLFTLSPEFSPNITSYTINGILSFSSSIDITALTAEANATMTINGTAVRSGTTKTVDGLEMLGGTITIPIVVTAPDGTTTKTYTVTANRNLF
jgi:hypothetical protein